MSEKFTITEKRALGAAGAAIVVAGGIVGLKALRDNAPAAEPVSTTAPVEQVTSSSTSTTIEVLAPLTPSSTIVVKAPTQPTKPRITTTTEAARHTTPEASADEAFIKILTRPQIGQKVLVKPVEALTIKQGAYLQSAPNSKASTVETLFETVSQPAVYDEKYVCWTRTGNPGTKALKPVCLELTAANLKNLTVLEGDKEIPFNPNTVASVEVTIASILEDGRGYTSSTPSNPNGLGVAVGNS